MRWNCPHCHAMLSVSDSDASRGWTFARCFRCGGFALIKPLKPAKAHIHNMKQRFDPSKFAPAPKAREAIALLKSSSVPNVPQPPSASPQPKIIKAERRKKEKEVQAPTTISNQPEKRVVDFTPTPPVARTIPSDTRPPVFRPLPQPLPEVLPSTASRWFSSIVTLVSVVTAVLGWQIYRQSDGHLSQTLPRRSSRNNSDWVKLQPPAPPSEAEREALEIIGLIKKNTFPGREIPSAKNALESTLR